MYALILTFFILPTMDGGAAVSTIQMDRAYSTHEECAEAFRDMSQGVKLAADTPVKPPLNLRQFGSVYVSGTCIKRGTEK